MQLNIDDLGVCGIIVDDWDITKEFKPKTITTDYTSWICYISRRPVPANTPITDTYYWKPICRLEQNVSFDYNAFKKTIETLVYSFIHTSESGVVFTNEFGDNEDIGINQKTLTEAFNKVWAKIDELSGEVTNELEMTVTPEYYIGEDGCNVHYSADSEGLSGIFEHIKFLADGVVVAEADNVATFEGSTTINDTTVIRCEAQVMGVLHTKEQTVEHFSSFYLGAGTQYSDVMDVDHLIPVTPGVEVRREVTCEEGDNIFIVIGKAFESTFQRADMNGFEIPFAKYPDNEHDVVIDGKVYVVLKSVNTYVAGTYEISIND